MLELILAQIQLLFIDGGVLGMFTTADSVISKLTNGVNSIGEAVLVLVATVVVLGTGISGIVFIGKGDVKKGLMFLLFAALAFVVAIVIYGAMTTVGEETGRDLSNMIKGSSALLSIAPVYASYHMNRLRSKEDVA